MQIVANEQVVCFDIDETLILWGKLKRKHKVVAVSCPYSNRQEYLRVHEPHVKIFRDRLARGATILCWSANGYRWATAVLKALGLEHAQVIVMSKPCAYVDDKVCTDWMGEHIYIDPDSTYK